MWCSFIARSPRTWITQDFMWMVLPGVTQYATFTTECSDPVYKLQMERV